MGSKSLREKQSAEICKKKCRASPGNSESSLEYSLEAVSCKGVVAVPVVSAGVVCDTTGFVSALLCVSCAALGCAAPEASGPKEAVLCLAAGATGGQSAGGCCCSERTVPATVARPLHDDGGSCGFLCLHAG